jgi:DNA polymerase-3 subunit delta'
MPYSDVVGHRQIVSLLARAIRHDRLPPSLIFSGPSGVGKRLVAIATAQAVNCLALQQRPDAESSSPTLALDACGTCASCTRIARGVHPDVLVLSPGDSGSLKVDEIRAAVERAAYRPFEGQRRLVIIDDADTLVVAAQNALLKTLEEPPSASVFVLITARPDMLLATVRSRCPVFRFRALDGREVTAILVRLGRPEPEAQALAAGAEGSAGRALAARADDVLASRHIAIRVLTRAAASSDPRRLLESAKDLLTGTGSGGAADREVVGAHLRAVASLLRDAACRGVACGPEPPALINADVAPAVERLTAFHGERAVRAFAAVTAALEALDRNAGVKAVADWVALQL